MKNEYYIRRYGFVVYHFSDGFWGWYIKFTSQDNFETYIRSEGNSNLNYEKLTIKEYNNLPSYIDVAEI